jgi:hypothetical protein
MRKDVPAIWIIDVADGPARRLVEPGWSSSWSRDGRWIYYSSPAHQSAKIFKISVSGGSPLQVVDTGELDYRAVPAGIASASGRVRGRAWQVGLIPVESSDGKLLFFQGPRGLWKHSLSEGHSEFVDELPSTRSLCRDGVFFLGQAQQPDRRSLLMFYRFADRSRVEVTKAALTQNSLAASDDCKTVLYAQIQKQESDLVFARGLW